jgi:hypothetical protein
MTTHTTIAARRSPSSASLSRLLGRSSLALAVAFGIVELATVSPAVAADTKAINASPAKVDIQTVEFKMKSITKKMDKNEWQNPTGIGELQNLLLDVNTRLERIKQKDPSWDVSSYEAFLKDAVAKWEKAANAQQAKEDAVNTELEHRANFATVVDRYGNALDAGFHVVDEEVPGELSELTEDLKLIVTVLPQLAKECESQSYLEIQKYYTKESRAKQPEQVCTLASAVDELVQAFVPLAAKARLDDQLAKDKKALDDLKKGDLDDYTLERLGDPAAHAKKVAADFASATSKTGVKTATDYFKPIETQASTFKDVLATAAKTDRFPKFTATDTKLASEVTSATKAKGGSVSKFKLHGTTYINKNDIDIPTQQWTTGAVTVKMPKETFCRLYEVKFVGTYLGGGKYAPLSYAGGLGDSSFRVTSCP